MEHHLTLAANSPSPSSTSSSAITAGNNRAQTPASDPMHSWWESISKARSRIEALISLLPSSAADSLSSLADSDRPALSLLSSAAAYSAVADSLAAPLSGSGADPLCHWLYDTFLASDPSLRLVVAAFLPLVAGIYLSRLHSLSSDSSSLPSLAGFEAVLLAVYAAEAKARAGKPVLVSVPDLSQPSLYHSPRPQASSAAGITAGAARIGVVSPPLEPQTAVKSTKRACIVGVALDFFYKQIVQMPAWSKLDFCRFSAAWAGQECSCEREFDGEESGTEASSVVDFSDGEISGGIEQLRIENGGSGESSRGGEFGGKGSRIPLPWELLQPALRILGHCLLAPLNSQDVKDAASVVVRRLYARASHDLVPQAILATRSLIQLDKRARADAKAAAVVEAATMTHSSSNVNTPSKAKKPEILLVSK